MEQAAIESGATGPDATARGSRQGDGLGEVRDGPSGGGFPGVSGFGGVVGGYSGKSSGGNVGRSAGNPEDCSGAAPGLSGGERLEQIYQSTRTLCRCLRRSPKAMEVLLKFAEKNPRPQSAVLFNQYFGDLMGIMYQRLSTTMEEQARGFQPFHSLSCATACFSSS